jgi:hypothetical protein
VAYEALSDPAQLPSATILYVITTNVTTTNSQPRHPLVQLFGSVPGAHLVYRNSDVQILEIKGP